MPYVSDPNLDPNQQTSGTNTATQPAGQVGQVSGQPNVVSGSTGTQSTVQSPNSATQAPQAPTLASGGGVTGPTAGQGSKAPAYDASAPTSAGNWTNLQNYLSANNSGQFGRDLSGKIEGNVNQAQSSISSAGTNFSNQVQAGTNVDNQALDQEVTSSPQTMSQADQTAFEKELNGSYTGPQSASNDAGFQAAHEQAHAAFGEAEAAKTPGGQQALLSKYYAAPQYTSGEKSLDAALLSSDPAAQAALSQLANEASGLPVAYRNAERDANNAAGNAAATSNATQTAAANLLGVSGPHGNLVQKESSTGVPMTDQYGNQLYSGAIGDVMNAVNDRVGSDIANNATAVDAARAALGSHNLSNLTPDEINNLNGLQTYTGDLWSGGKGVPLALSNYLTPTDPSHYARDTVITPDEQAKLSALEQLAGLQNSFASDASKAGTAPTSPYTFNYGQFESDVAANQAAAMNAAMGTIVHDPITATDTTLQQAFNDVTNHPGDTADFNNLQALYNTFLNQYGGDVAGRGGGATLAGAVAPPGPVTRGGPKIGGPIIATNQGASAAHTPLTRGGPNYGGPIVATNQNAESDE